MGRSGQVLRDHREQLDDLCFDGLELAVKFLSLPDHNQSLVADLPIT
jgi:hypothetical protein